MRRFHSIAFVVLLGACGSGGGDNDAGAGGANADGIAPVNGDLVAGQSNNQARFDQARFSSASFTTEASSGRYGTDKFR